MTTRREATEIGEETGIDESSCIGLKCLTEEEGVQFLRMRSGTTEEGSDIRELVRELGRLPLALDQASAYIRCVRQSVKDYMKKYKEERLRLLQKKKARNLVQYTSSERLAVHTTWQLNFDHITRISEEIDLGEIPALVMKISAYLGPDDIPYEVINEGLNIKENTEVERDKWNPAEIMSLLTKFSLFERHGPLSFRVHRLVQEVIRSEMEKNETELRVLSFAVRVVHHALANTLSPAEVCKSFVEDAVFNVENPPSLQLWGRLASHATYLQEHLRRFSLRYENDVESVHILLNTEETVRILNEAAIFLSVSQQKVKAQAIQEMKLELLVHLETSATGDDSNLPHYFIDVPLKDKDYKVISCCMRQLPENEVVAEEVPFHDAREGKANRLREEGNIAVKNSKIKEALGLYSRAIDLWSGDYRLFCNRALCYLKLGQPSDALDDCQKSLSLQPYYSKALQRKAWALRELVEKGHDELKGQARAALAVAVHFDSNLRRDKTFSEMFPEAFEIPIAEINNGILLQFYLRMQLKNVTLLLHEGEYNVSHLFFCSDLQIVGLGPRPVITCSEAFLLTDCRCFFENIVFSKGSAALFCRGKECSIHMTHCEISGGKAGCEDFPECNGGQGCIVACSDKPACNRTGRFGEVSPSGMAGNAGLQIVEGSSALIENCIIHDCGGGGALVGGEGSRMLVIKYEIHRNRLAGLEARDGGELVASRNKIFDNSWHGILIGPRAGKCDVNGNQIFENVKEGIRVVHSKNKIVLHENEIHHNRPFGLSLEDSVEMLITGNKIFENGFWGIFAQSGTSAHIEKNVLNGNKCGGIFIGVNFSGRVHLEYNIVRDHSGPWLEYQKGMKDEFSPLFSFSSQLYSNPPIVKENKEFNNKEGIYHPREVAQRLHRGCTYCRSSKGNVQLLKQCLGCHIASYCSRECQRKHRSKHRALCKAIKSRYSVTVETIPMGKLGDIVFDVHLKDPGKGPKLELNSCKRFIVKIQTLHLNCHPRQLLNVYDRSKTILCTIKSPEIFNVITECGVLGSLIRFTSKKVLFWATLAEGGEKLTIFLDHLAPYQEW